MIPKPETSRHANSLLITRNLLATLILISNFLLVYHTNHIEIQFNGLQFRPILCRLVPKRLISNPIVTDHIQIDHRTYHFHLLKGKLPPTPDHLPILPNIPHRLTWSSPGRQNTIFRRHSRVDWRTGKLRPVCWSPRGEGGLVSSACAVRGGWKKGLGLSPPPAASTRC